MEDSDLSPPFETSESDLIIPKQSVVKKPKEPKEKKIKRPSDFEIIKTLLQRITDRKLPFILKDTGEDSDLLLLCTQKEDEFAYGSADTAICLFEWTNDDLKIMSQTFLDKLLGYHSDRQFQRIINLRDQVSELSKTKGESMDIEIKSDSFDTHFTIKTDKDGKRRALYFSKAVESLYHMQQVGTWCEKYRPLLTTQDPEHAYYPYTHEIEKTSAPVTLPPQTGNHPLASLYPHGFRFLATKGLDVLLAKPLKDFPYPLLLEELIVFRHRSYCVQIAHRMIGDGWRCVLVRPNAVYFPAASIHLPQMESHVL